jgi:hypothetical protein
MLTRTTLNSQHSTSQHNGRHFSCSEILSEFFTAKCAKCVGDRIDGCHRVRGASAVKAAEQGSQVVIHGDFNVDLDREEDKGYYMASLAESLTECTSTAGLETHVTAPTFRSFGSFLPRGDIPSPAGDLQRPPGDVARSAGGGQSPAGGGPSPAGDHHRYSRLDHIYTKGLVSESVVLPNSTTDYRPVVTTVRAGSHGPGATKQVS